jgi:hypothetical protein
MKPIIPFGSGFGVWRWFLLVNMAIAAVSACLANGYWRFALLIAAVLIAELSGLIGKRFAYLWSAAGWFRLAVVLQLGVQAALLVAVRATGNPEFSFWGFAVGILLVLCFLIPVSRFVKSIHPDSFKAPDPDL